jgi:uncharacterized protein YecE (DUF72 family)
MKKAVLFGASTWTYKGWEGLVYRDLAKYGPHFRRDSLEEYARNEIFDCVGLDSSYYRPPTLDRAERMALQLPPGFLLVVKVLRDLTNPVYTKSFGENGCAGAKNPAFLNPRVFLAEFLPVFRERLSDHIGTFVLQFPRISPREMAFDGFLKRLDHFLGELGGKWPISVEIRNSEFLHPEYFALLRAHGAAHVFQVWTHMPLPHQVLHRFPESLESASFGVCRALVPPGRDYALAVKEYMPYRRIGRVESEVRESLIQLSEEGMKKNVPIMMTVNNRLEGCAPLTIQALEKEIALRRGNDSGGKCAPTL